MICEITDKMLDELRIRVRRYVNEKTYGHILAVEREAASLAALYIPDKIKEARAAALLHDITKNESAEKQLKYIKEFDIIADVDPLSPKLYHAKTAAALIPRDFPEYNTTEIVNAVKWHTTGYDGMTLLESVVYLADYIEDTRTYDDCVQLRRYFYEGLAETKNDKDKKFHLYKTMIKSFDYTMSILIRENALIDNYTVSARNYFLRIIKNNDMEIRI